MSNQRKPPSSSSEPVKQSYHLAPSPAAMAFATRITEEQFRDVYLFASMIDEIAEEARRNERARIFKMSFSDLFREILNSKKVYRRE